MLKEFFFLEKNYSSTDIDSDQKTFDAFGNLILTEIIMTRFSDMNLHSVENKVKYDVYFTNLLLKCDIKVCVWITIY